NTVSVLLNAGTGDFTGQVYTIVGPLVQSITRTTPAGPNTNGTSVSYTVTFSTSVIGVDASDFRVTTGGSVQVTTPVVVTGSGAVYTVTVNGIHGSGDLRLDLVDDDSIQSSGASLGGT